MLNRLDHIIKKALGQFEAQNKPDWKVFYPLLRAEDGMSVGEDHIEEVTLQEDQIAFHALDDLDYSGPLAGWSLFEGRLDAFNDAMDADFDQAITEGLENLEVNALNESGWSSFEPGLDALNEAMDAEFDQAISESLQSVSEATWNESHWLLLSQRLDAINDRPRILLMKVVEAAAVLFILIQLSSLYSEFQIRNGEQESLLTYFKNVFGDNLSAGDEETTVPSNTFPSGYPEYQALNGEDHADGQDIGERTTDFSDQASLFDEDNRINTLVGSVSEEDVAVHKENESFTIVDQLPERSHKIVYSQLQEPGQNYDYEFYSPISQLETSHSLITYNGLPRSLFNQTSPRLGMRDMSLLTASTTDSILNSIPTLQVIKPRIYSAMEIGALADVTKVDIRKAFPAPGVKSTFEELSLNPGIYFRYKIQYQDVFGAIGADFVQMKYDGLLYPNELALVTLPFELGYNIINLSSFRMFVSGGVAGRFVPVADYSADPFNLESNYSFKSNKKSNGLLYNGPFDINSYLSGRVSLGFDVNVNKTMSIGIRFTHDMWLKGGGIGYNQDKFRSSHIGLGTSYHF